jgi:hypothetical protein
MGPGVQSAAETAPKLNANRMMAMPVFMSSPPEVTPNPGRV